MVIEQLFMYRIFAFVDFTSACIKAGLGLMVLGSVLRGDQQHLGVASPGYLSTPVEGTMKGTAVRQRVRSVLQSNDLTNEVLIPLVTVGGPDSDNNLSGQL